MESDQPVYIYELRDPDTGSVRYVGRSKNTENRLRSHLEMAKHHTHHSPKMNEWLGLLIEQGKSPVMIIAKITTWEKREAEEMNHIHALLDQGCDLLNAVVYTAYRYQRDGMITTRQRALYKVVGSLYFYSCIDGADALILNKIGNRALIALYNLRDDKIECKTVDISRLEERTEDSLIDQVLQQVSEEQAGSKEWALYYYSPTKNNPTEERTA